MQAKEYIKKLISVNDTAQAIERLNDLAKQLNTEQQNQIFLLSAGFNKLQEDIEKGIVSDENKRLNVNKINNKLLTIAAGLPNDLKIDISNIVKKRLSIHRVLLRNKLVIISGIWLLVGLLGLYTGITPKKNLNVQLEVDVSRVAFNNLKKSELKVDNDYGYITINNFSEVNIPAIGMEVLNGNGSDTIYHKIDQPLFNVLPKPNNEVSIVLEDLLLENLKIDENIQVVLETPQGYEEDEAFLGLTFNPGNVRGELVLQDRLKFQCNYCIFELSREENNNMEHSFIEGIIIGPENQALPMGFKGKDHIISLELEPKIAGGVLLHQKQALLISKLQFLVPDGKGSVISSVLSGKLNFIDQKNRPYNSLELEENVFLSLKNQKNIILTSVLIEGKNIKLNAVGEVGEILSGLNKDDLKKQNPSILEWLYHNNLSLLIFILGSSLFISLVLHLRLKKL